MTRASLLAGLVACAALAVGAGCEVNGERAVDAPRNAGSVRPPAPDPSKPVKVTLLYTSDEHGWMLPFTEQGRTWGGAAAVLGEWVAREGHCPGPPPLGAPTPTQPPQCSDLSTLAISGGDNYTGPAISTFFAGASMAEAMRRMGYGASTFGNHEFDFGLDTFLKNRSISGVPFLGANLKVIDPRLQKCSLPKFTTFERRGARIAVVGVATDTTPVTAMPTRFVGLEFLPEEPALDDAIREAWATHPDAVIAVAHECPDKLAPMLERHPEWKLAFFGGAHCHKVMTQTIGGVSLMSPGWRLAYYVRVALEIDRSRPEKDRVVRADAQIVETSREPGQVPYPPDPTLQALVAGYEERMEAALGERIATTRNGLAKDSRDIAHWITTAWREELQTDVAVINLGGIRQGIPKGPITMAMLWSVMPFDNKIVICKLKGKDLAIDLAANELAAAGISPGRSGFVLANGKPLEPERLYTVATIDFLYLGGAKARFRQQDPSANDTNIDWRTPVIAWSKRAVARGSPIEALLPPGGVHNP